MQRRCQHQTPAIDWKHNINAFTYIFLISIYLLFTSQSFAETNARGIEVIYILDDLIVEETTTEIESPAIATNTEHAFEQAPQNTDLWLRIQAGYAMPDIISPHTAKYETLYASRPDYVEKMMARSHKYLFYVVEEVEKRGMPMEIALLPMIESAYNPQAVSRSKAVGIWQFMPATGKHFGLKQNWWADHRRDVIASTDAALNYLEKLHGLFGSWDLALAAYNAGEGTVGRAIARNRKAGLPTDYQSLRLPQETTHYVPKLQAIKNIVNNPQQYGLFIAPIPDEAYFAIVDAPPQIDAKLAANLAEISDQEFALLNPRFNRPVAASKNGVHKLLLPVTAVSRFQQNLNSNNQPLISWKIYHAKRGEKVTSIAKKFKMKTSQLRKVNSLKGKKIYNTRHLLVPSKQSKLDKINIAKLANQKITSQHRQSRRVIHKIKRGETLSTLAKRYGTNTRTLMRINRLKSTRIRIGQIIRVKGKARRTKTKRI